MTRLAVFGLASLLAGCIVADEQEGGAGATGGTGGTGGAGATGGAGGAGGMGGAIPLDAGPNVGGAGGFEFDAGIVPPEANPFGAAAGRWEATFTGGDYQLGHVEVGTQHAPHMVYASASIHEGECSGTRHLVLEVQANLETGHGSVWNEFDCPPAELPQGSLHDFNFLLVHNYFWDHGPFGALGGRWQAYGPRLPDDCALTVQQDRFEADCGPYSWSGSYTPTDAAGQNQAGVEIALSHIDGPRLGLPRPAPANYGQLPGSWAMQMGGYEPHVEPSLTFTVGADGGLEARANWQRRDWNCDYTAMVLYPAGVEVDINNGQAAGTFWVESCDGRDTAPISAAKNEAAAPTRIYGLLDGSWRLNIGDVACEVSIGAPSPFHGFVAECDGGVVIGQSVEGLFTVSTDAGAEMAVYRTAE